MTTLTETKDQSAYRRLHEAKYLVGMSGVLVRYQREIYAVIGGAGDDKLAITREIGVTPHYVKDVQLVSASQCHIVAMADAGDLRRVADALAV